MKKITLSLFFCLFMSASTIEAGVPNYEFIEVASSGQVLNTDLSYFPSQPVLNNFGNVGYLQNFMQGCCTVSNQQIHLFNGVSSNLLLDTFQPQYSHLTALRSLDMNDFDSFAFFDSPTNFQSVYELNAGGLQRIISSDDQFEPDFNFWIDVDSGISIGNNGAIAFQGYLDNIPAPRSQAVFRAVGPATDETDLDIIALGEDLGGPFRFFDGSFGNINRVAFIKDNGEVIFTSNAGFPDVGLFGGDGRDESGFPISRINPGALSDYRSLLFPEQIGLDVGLFHYSISGNGNIVFTGRFDEDGVNKEGVFIGNGSEVSIDDFLRIYEKISSASILGTSINDNADVFFYQFTPLSSHPKLNSNLYDLFVSSGSEIELLLSSGDSLFGKTIDALISPEKRGINDNGQLTFRATFTDGSSSIVLANPLQGNASPSATAIPEPTTIAMLGMGLVGWGMTRRKNR